MVIYQSRCSPGLSLRAITFLTFINDIVTEIGSNIRLFADDTSLYIVVTDSDASAEILSPDLMKIDNLAD